MPQKLNDSGTGISAAETSVRQLIANGKHKTALDRAKEVHKAWATPQSEALLLDAYAARIQALIRQNLTVEANSLLGLVRERYPSAVDRLAGLTASATVRSGKLDESVAPLNNPGLPEQQRAAIEHAIEQELFDLAALADCTALPPEHLLRQSAAALQRAFVAVTSGPVADDATALPEVSRRSPLAAWKMLVGAIAAFYRRDDEACRRCLGAIKPESAPARLIPVMEAMLDGKPRIGLNAASAELLSQIEGDAMALRPAIEDLDRAFNSEDSLSRLMSAIRSAVQECRRTIQASSKS